MKKLVIIGIAVWFTCWCILSLCFISPAYAEKIPPLSEIPPDLPLEKRVQLSKQRQVLEKELAGFQAAAAAFNAKDAKEQSDAEYERLDAWRTRYINTAKAFNQEVSEARAVPNKPGNVTAYTVQLGSVRGEFSIENSDGSRLTNANIQSGRVARVDTGTRVTTGSTGRLQITLPDETVFTIGPNSDMVIDEFVYDTDNSARKISASVRKGIFRWVTGKVARKDPAHMKVTLPVGETGIRGTDVEVEVAPGGSGYVKLFSGEVEITPKRTGVKFVLNAGHIVTYKADGTFSEPERIK